MQHHNVPDNYPMPEADGEQTCLICSVLSAISICRIASAEENCLKTEELSASSGTDAIDQLGWSQLSCNITQALIPWVTCI
jgi:hypothetical protein